MNTKLNKVFHYAVVRFMPYIETREFANIGIVLIEPKTGQFLYQLAPKRFARVTRFFEDLDGNLYKNGIDVFKNELKRFQTYQITRNIFGKKLVEQFNELTRHRESVLHFSEVGRIAGSDANRVLTDLYQRFVARDFVTKEYREQTMAKILRHKFNEVLPIKYHEKTLTAGVYDITVPFAYKLENVYKVIKPLAFDQKTPIKAVEHGEIWIRRMQKLVAKKLILPEHALFTIEKPNHNEGELLQIHDDIVTEAHCLGLKTLDFANLTPIVEFAKADILPH